MHEGHKLRFLGFAHPSLRQAELALRRLEAGARPAGRALDPLDPGTSAFDKGGMSKRGSGRRPSQQGASRAVLGSRLHGLVAKVFGDSRGHKEQGKDSGAQSTRASKKNGLAALLGISRESLQRHFMEPALCTEEGHPVDVATGKLRTEVNDFEEDSLSLVRVWVSTSTYQGPLGNGWHHEYDLALATEDESAVVRLGDGRGISLPIPMVGASTTDRRNGLTLCRVEDGYQLYTRGGDAYLFGPVGRRDGSYGVLAFWGADGKYRHFQYSAQGVMVQVADVVLGEELRFSHDVHGRVETIVHAGASGRKALSYVYDGAGNLVEVTEGRGNKLRYEYGGRLLTAEVDRTGYTFHFKWDGQGAGARCVETYGDGRLFSRKLRYSPEKRVTLVEQEAGHTTRYEYNALGLVTVEQTGKEVRRFEWDEDGRLNEEVDSKGHMTRYDYHAGTGQLLRFAPHGSGPFTLQWQDGVVKALVGPDGKRWGRVEDEDGPLFIAPLAEPRAFRQDGRGLPMIVEDPRFGALPEHPLGFEYGDRLTLEALQDAQSAQVWPRDLRALGRLAADRKEHFSGRGVTLLSNGSHPVSLELDGDGQVVTYNDADGAVQRTRYLWHFPTHQADGMGNETQFRYGASEQVEEVTDAGRTTTLFQYDAHRRLVSVHRHGAVQERYRYDPGGLIVEKQDGKEAPLLGMEYDAFGRCKTVRLSSGELYRYSFDASGRCLKIVDNEGTTRFEYDANGRLRVDERSGAPRSGDEARGDAVKASGVGPVANGNIDVGKVDCYRVVHVWEYDRLSETSVFDRFVTRYGEESGSGNVVAIFDPTGKRHRLDVHESGGVRLRLSNKTEVLQRYNAAGQPTAIVVSRNGWSPEAWVRFFEYSPGGDLVCTEDSEAGTTQYKYDAGHRLVLARTRQNGANEGPHSVHQEKRFVYDSANNLVEQPGLTHTAMGSGNRFTSVRHLNVTYNERQHIETLGKTKFTYDSWDRLCRCEAPGGDWTAGYDGAGRRLWKRHGERMTRFVWDGNRIAAEVDPNGRLRVYVFVDTKSLVPFMFVDYPSVDADPAVGERFFIFVDQRGAPCRVVDDAGMVAWSARLDPYGTAHVDPESRILFSMRMPGHYHDAEIGLHQNRFRDYLPDFGRYLQSDPSGLAGGINLYAYSSRPLTEVDLVGLNPCTDEFRVTRLIRRGLSRITRPITEAVRDTAPRRFIWGDERVRHGRFLIDHMPPMRTQLVKPNLTALIPVVHPNLNCGWYSTKAILHHWAMRLHPDGHRQRVPIPGWRHRLWVAWDPEQHGEGELLAAFGRNGAQGGGPGDINAWRQVLEQHGPILVNGRVGLADWGEGDPDADPRLTQFREWIGAQDGTHVGVQHYLTVVGVDTVNNRIAYKDPLNVIDRVTWTDFANFNARVEGYTYLTEADARAILPQLNPDIRMN